MQGKKAIIKASSIILYIDKLTLSLVSNRLYISRQNLSSSRFTDEMQCSWLLTTRRFKLMIFCSKLFWVEFSLRDWTANTTRAHQWRTQKNVVQQGLLVKAKSSSFLNFLSDNSVRFLVLSFKLELSRYLRESSEYCLGCRSVDFPRKVFLMGKSWLRGY